MPTGYTELLRFLHEVLQDVRCEMGEPEVAELLTLALDRKVDRGIELLEKEMGITQEQPLD
jgi:hypothetical protein